MSMSSSDYYKYSISHPFQYQTQKDRFSISMNKKYINYYTSIFSRIYVTEEAVKYPTSERALEMLSSLPYKIIKRKENIPQEHLNKNTLLITSPKGRTVGKCPGSKGHLCCNYLTADLYLGCTMGCSYCIMKSYLNFAPITVYANPYPSINEIKKIAEKNPEGTVRVGTGETGDSLQFDPLFRISEIFIKELADYKNVFFEMKTKTPFVEHLLGIEKKGNAIIGFSINPPEIIEKEETGAFPLDERLKAAEKAVEAGFNITFHFDPIIAVHGWEKLYRETAEKLLDFPEEKIKWISLGTIRYSSMLKEKMEEKSLSGGGSYLTDEFVRCRDGKYRYIQKERGEIFKTMKEALSPLKKVPIYMCMESKTMWDKVFGSQPLKSPNNRAIFQPLKRGVSKHKRI